MFMKYFANIWPYIEISLNTLRNIPNYMCDLEPFSKYDHILWSLQELWLHLSCSQQTLNKCNVHSQGSLVYVNFIMIVYSVWQDHCKLKFIIATAVSSSCKGFVTCLPFSHFHTEAIIMSLLFKCTTTQALFYVP